MTNMSSQQEFLRLFLASEMDVYRYVASMVPRTVDTQDIVQQTAAILWEKFDDYDPSRPFTPWACRFARNVARQWMDRQKHWKTFLDKGMLEILLEEREELKPEFDERLTHLASCIKKLPDNQRNIIDGYYCQEMDIENVAERGNKTVAATYKQLQRIREKLRHCIESQHRLSQLPMEGGA